MVVLGYILPVDLRKEEKMVEYKVIDRKDIPESYKTENKRKRNNDGRLLHVVLEFNSNDTDCIEVFADGYANGNNLRRAIEQYIDAFGLDKINVTIRGNRVFLLKR